jgi:EAL domain-containing protein (putative c-di-GMP-specific phosphodiesterase class I)
MRELNEIGIRFSIDDFGTGYSSLTYLKQLPLFELKIDKSFIQDAPGDSSDTAIVQLILGMAKHLRLRVVAEGVETQEQYDFLKQNNCDCLQGFLLARPVRLSEWALTQEVAEESASLSTSSSMPSPVPRLAFIDR